ncbi:type IV pilus biogenesis/stability protein PilW [Dasania sp. GY-MA-18]|uniref:Type IV pilus biogenesis/stability protein PilW n=1 Tax=Dasania phycosphaerae TaxID=2950436 RepID=A0A9J6RQ33_9GAMM|nr:MULTISPECIES: type IV pilus biogenesis/stability protein PilW [Dasania]MCR8924169.1 type IV pilus biogenesis/stability protein PilW [Dasania sp. GY-MA-18]MCZ0866822.1 type IV pilus biogenesis/stability protein PilW [Dasania phycosphaerae]MCZ0870327.1 type IV pilus biogenesis/stability protein PilW [Dasania phycosphaerae]
MNTDNNKTLVIIRSVITHTLLALLLVGCVTTETGMFTEKTDDKKALEYSIQLAKRYISERKWELAKRHLKNALELDEDSAEVHEALALVFQNTGEFERAEKHFKEAIDLDRSLSRARLNYASFLYTLQRYSEAAEQLEVVVKDTLYERRQTAFINLGRCYYSMMRYEDAEQSFRTAYLMSDRHHPALILQMADVYYRLGQFALSQRYYDSYGSKVKSKSATALLLGARLAKQFDDKHAISSYGLALKNLYPRSQQYLDYKQEFLHGS